MPTVAANKHYPHGRCCTIARRSDNLQACVCVASCHHFPCVPAVRLCVARLASTFLALWPSCSACVRACCSALGLPFLAHPFGGGAVTEVLHDLLCGFALSTVRHDLPSKKKKKKKKSSRSFRPAGATAGSSAVRRQTAFWSCAGQPRTPRPSPLRALAKLRAAAGASAGATAAAAAGAGVRNSCFLRRYFYSTLLLLAPSRLFLHLRHWLAGLCSWALSYRRLYHVLLP